MMKERGMPCDDGKIPENRVTQKQIRMEHRIVQRNLQRVRFIVIHGISGRKREYVLLAGINAMALIFKSSKKRSIRLIPDFECRRPVIPRPINRIFRPGENRREAARFRDIDRNSLPCLLLVI